MIAYDLTCGSGHQFEAWFKSYRNFDRQRKRRLIQCPVCDSAEIEIVFRPQAIRKKTPLQPPAPGTQHLGERIETFLRDNFEDVGDNFAEEARRLHYGESEPRNIRGHTTPAEEEDLQSEGVAFLKVAIPKPSN
jgi:hypothetical protein